MDANFKSQTHGKKERKIFIFYFEPLLPRLASSTFEKGSNRSHRISMFEELQQGH
jgi:hypothetical protein